MAVSANSEFSIIRGTSETLNIVIYKTNGVVLDLTGNSSMSLYIAPELRTASPTLTKTLSLVSGSPATAGYVTCTFAPSDTSSLTPGEYIAEAHIVYGSGTEYRTNQPFSFKIFERVKT